MEFPYDPENGLFESFEITMPEANVTLTAHYEKMPDLYLLGTANGNSAWHTTGPQFVYNDGFYRTTVYFKGYSDRDDESDGKGYFVLSKAANDNDDWTAIPQDQLLVASRDKFAAPANGGAMLQTSEDAQYALPFGNRFMIEPGIYDIEVDEDYSMMYITGYKPNVNIDPSQTVQSLGAEVTMYEELHDRQFYIEDQDYFIKKWLELIQYLNPNERDIDIHYTVTDDNGTREGYDLNDVVELRTVGENVVTATTSVGYINATDTRTYRVYDTSAGSETGDPLEYIESMASSARYHNNTHAVVSDELIGVWGAQNILWAKDQGQRSLTFTSPKAGTTDYVRDIYNFQHHEWDQSNWVMLDFGELYPGWDDPDNPAQPEIFRAMHEKIASYVDHKIQAGTISGTFLAHQAEIGHYGNYDKMMCTIKLDEFPVAIAYQSGETSLGYPGYMSDPTEKPGVVYENPDEEYMYNHYVPCNFTLSNLDECGISAGWSYVDQYLYKEVPSFFFMPPKDQEVAHVWAAYMGEIEVDSDPVTLEPIVKDVFAVLETDYENPGGIINAYNLEGEFYVEDWKYNRLGDPNDLLYGRPEDLESAYEGQESAAGGFLFHIAIQYYYYAMLPVISGKLGYDSRTFRYLVYPLDMTRSGSWTHVDEKPAVNSLVETEIDSILYYNVMGQESRTPFDGINIEVIRYKDGSKISRKILR